MDFVQAGLTPVGFFETNLIYAFAVYALTLTLDIKQFTVLFSQRRQLLLGLVSQHIALPLLIILTTLVLYLPLGYSTGLMIVSAMPALVLGGLLTWMARGNVALSLLIIGISTFVSAAIAPVIISLWANWNPFAAHDASLLDYTPVYTLAVATGVILIPVLLGLLTRRLFPSVVQHAPKLIVISVFVAMCIPLGLIRNNIQLVIDSASTTGLTIGLIYLASFAFVFNLAKSLGLTKTGSSSIALTVCSQNAALAGLYLLSGLGPKTDQVLAGIWWVFFQYYGGLALVFYLRRSISAASTR